MKKLIPILMLLVMLCAARGASALPPPLPSPGSPTWCFKYRANEYFENHTLNQWAIWNNSTGSVGETTQTSYPAGGTAASIYISQYDAQGAFIILDHPYDAHYGYFTQLSNQRGCPTSIPQPTGNPKWCQLVAYVHAETHTTGSIQMLASDYTYQATYNFDLPPSGTNNWIGMQTDVVTSCTQNMIARIGFGKRIYEENRAYLDYITVNWWY